MNIDKIKKYNMQILNLVMFLILGILYKIFKLNNFYLLIILSYLLYTNASNFISIFYKDKIKNTLKILILIDIIYILLGSFNIKYIFTYMLIFLILLALIFKAEGIVGIKKIIGVFLIYLILKIIFIIFLI